MPNVLEEVLRYMKYKNKLEWQEQVLELLDKFIILTACEIESLLKLKGYKISRSQIYRFCASEPLIRSSSVLNGSKTLAYRTSRSLSSIEQYTILLHNEFFINKGMLFPKPQTKDSLFKYIPLRVEQLKNEISYKDNLMSELEEKISALKTQWEIEKNTITGEAGIKDEIDKVKIKIVGQAALLLPTEA